jgi:RNA12 protein
MIYGSHNLENVHISDSYFTIDDYKGDESLQQVVSVLGGRLTDLELLVQKMRAHLTPEGMK